mmetsp:Transcript_10941/g.14770  ORF Transcript_10941/g.14770 Transcript_10941/m.14770 type:complete len:126 (+) Transcript_10941:860-1237(+)
MQLYHIREPVFDKKKLPKEGEATAQSYMRQINPAAEYMAMQPRFSRDFTKLAYVARDQKFISHTTCYQLKQMAWPATGEEATSETVIDRVAAYPTDDQEFAGMYGYNDTYSSAQFLDDSNRYFIF